LNIKEPTTFFLFPARASECWPSIIENYVNPW